MVASSLGSSPAHGGLRTTRIVPSPQWNTAVFNGCGWCRRDRQYENPLEAQRRTSPTLQFKSDRHYVCSPCVGAIRQSEPALLLTGNGAKKKARLGDVQSSDELYNSHCCVVVAWEDQHNGKAPKPLRSKRREPEPPGGDGASSVNGGLPEDGVLQIDPDEEGLVDEKPSEVGSMQGQLLGAKTLLGVLWPVHQFIEKEGRKPTKKEIVVLTIAGRKHAGVLRKRECGYPTGSTKIYRQAYAKVENTTSLAKSSRQIREGETEDWFKAASSALDVNCKEDAEGQLILKGGVKRKHGDDDSDELGLNWDNGVEVQGAPDSDGEGAGGKRKAAAARSSKGSGRGKGGGGTGTGGAGASRGGGGEAGANAIPSPGKSGVAAAAKRDKEVSISENILLEIKQTSRSLQDPNTYHVITVKAAKGLLDRCATRLVPELVSVYTHGFDLVSGETKEMKILEELNVAKGQTDAMHALVRAIHAQLGTGSLYATGKALLLAVKAASREKVLSSVHSFYLELAVERELTACVAAQDWERYAQVLDLTAPPPAQEDPDHDPDEVTIRLLDGDAEKRANVSAMQDKFITKGLVDLLRQASAVDQVALYLNHICRVDIRSKGEANSIAEELALLAHAANPLAMGLADEVLVSAVEKLQKGTAMKVHKCLVLFPTGQQVMELAALAITKRKGDAICQSRLKAAENELHGALAPFATVAAEQSVAAAMDAMECITIRENTGRVEIREAVGKGMRTVTSTIAHLQMNASHRFMEARADGLEKLEAVLSAFEKAFQQQVAAHVSSLMRPVLVEMLTYFNTKKKEPSAVHRVRQAADKDAPDNEEEAAEVSVESQEAEGAGGPGAHGAEGEALVARLRAIAGRVVGLNVKLGTKALDVRSPSEFLKDMVMPGALEGITKVWEVTRNAILVLKLASEQLTDNIVAADNENVVALHDLLEKPVAAMQTCEEFEALRVCCREAILLGALTAISKALPKAVLDVVPALVVGDDEAAWGSEILAPLLNLDIKELGAAQLCSKALEQMSSLKTKEVTVQGKTFPFVFLMHASKIALAIHYMLNHNACEECSTADAFQQGGLLEKGDKLVKSIEGVRDCGFPEYELGVAFQEKLVSKVDNARVQLADKFLLRMEKEIEEFVKILSWREAKEGDDGSSISQMMDLADSMEISDAILADMLKLAQGTNAKKFYDAWKQAKRMNGDVNVFRQLFDQFTSGSAHLANVNRVLERDLAPASQVVATISAVQALARPLKKDEGRKEVCKSALTSINTKVLPTGVGLPPKIAEAIAKRQV